MSIDIIKIHQFTIEMIKILREKLKIYKDTWKTIYLDNLIHKLKEQVKEISYRNNIKRTKRQLLHIANYCYFIYQRLND